MQTWDKLKEVIRGTPVQRATRSRRKFRCASDLPRPPTLSILQSHPISAAHPLPMAAAAAAEDDEKKTQHPAFEHKRYVYTHPLSLSLSFILFNLRLPHFAPPLDLYQDRPDVSAEVPVSVSSSGAPFPPLPSPATVSSPLPSVFRRRFALIGAGGGPPAGFDRLIRIVRALILDRGVFLGLCL